MVICQPCDNRGIHRNDPHQWLWICLPGYRRPLLDDPEIAECAGDVKVGFRRFRANPTDPILLYRIGSLPVAEFGSKNAYAEFVAGFQSRKVISVCPHAPEASVEPSGENANEMTLSLWSSSVRKSLTSA